MLTGKSISNPKFRFIYWISGEKGKSLALLDAAESEGLAHARLSFLIIIIVAAMHGGCINLLSKYTSGHRYSLLLGDAQQVVL